MRTIEPAGRGGLRQAEPVRRAGDKGLLQQGAENDAQVQVLVAKLHDMDNGIYKSSVGRISPGLPVSDPNRRGRTDQNLVQSASLSSIRDRFIHARFHHG
ncbi:hypothetical protein [Falsiroseomonas tokyonensis]|uniref:Uncharacterized protein n=1 Tax=Falsiroseomonas tokyonensis TaxID=430521 RepID=A0ABV7BXE8_9PROT|nr:hypothetical protein [Falsiroseomonas tokyonensis]MBU8538860.1 hypothetical protein [Falsiroseomonas tokyonensis]